MTSMQQNTAPGSNRGYILPSLVLVFAIILCILAYTNYYQNERDTFAADDAVSTIPASAGADEHGAQIRQLEQLLSRARSDLEQRLHELEKQLAERPASTESGFRDAPITDHRNSELLANLDQWQESTNRRIGMIQDGFEASLESLEARISNTAPADGHISAYRPQSVHIEQLEQHLASIEQRLTQISDTYATRLELMENSMEYLAESRLDSPYRDTTPARASNKTELFQLQDQFNQATGTYDMRMDILERRLAKADRLSRKRFEDIEKTLEMTAKRLEIFTTTAASETELEKSATVRAANETIKAHPPAAIQPAPQEVSRNEGTTAGSIQTAEIPPKIIASSPDIPGQDSSMAADAWSVNLASYAREGMADRKLGDFQNRGVMAEKVATTVHGKTMYRLRLTGFDSLESARAGTPEIKQKLGLKEVWISRN